MSGSVPSAVVRDVQTLLSVGVIGGLTDRQLLDLFVTRRDAGAEAAFSVIVQRHGRMVWGVCRRILNDPHAAADAFQATFLILVRKADSVRVDDSLGRWLYGVSQKVAMRARVTIARRSARETGGVETVADSGSSPDRSGLLAELDEEIGRLPERYRAVVVLCDLDGTTHEEAARQLGCAVGTVGSRLSRGRAQLRDRLTRRGLVPVAGLVGTILPGETARAAVPLGLVKATSRAAHHIAAGETALLTSNVSALLTGTMKAMLVTQLKLVAAVALIATSGLTILAIGAASAPKAPPAAVNEGAPIGPGAESPRQILGRMERTYATAQSYEDEGEVSTVYIEPLGKRTVKKPFSTKFVRPKLFRYEFSERRGDGEDERNRYIIWSDAAPGRAKHWWTIQPEVKVETLELAIGSAGGVSGKSSTTVPNMLMFTKIYGFSLSGFKEFKLVGEEAVDKTPCHKIEGKDVVGNPQTVWIDKATSLLRKIFHTSKFPTFALEETTLYRPRINVAIDPKEFEFEPPKP